LDLYVGSLAERPASRPLDLLVTWSNLRSLQPQTLREATAQAFSDSDQVDRQAYERIVSGFLLHRESLLEHSWMVLVEGKPVGACLVSLRDYYSCQQDYPYIDLVATSPTYGGRGLGSALLAQAMATLTQDGHRSIVHAHIRRGNIASERLFKGQGYQRWRRDD
jgi:ribosomal protein S18 acetylase RimI-like enzyme